MYESNDPEWIQQLHSKMEIISGGIQFNFVYVGKKSLIQPQSRGMSLSPTQIHFFWLRLESMRKSRLRLGKTAAADHILQEVSALLDFDESQKGWAIFGVGSSTETLWLQGDELMNCLSHFPEWGKNVGKWGFLNSIKMFLEPPLVDEPCTQSTAVVPFEQGRGLNEGFLRCGKCKHPYKRYIVYQ